MISRNGFHSKNSSLPTMDVAWRWYTFFSLVTWCPMARSTCATNAGNVSAEGASRHTLARASSENILVWRYLLPLSLSAFGRISSSINRSTAPTWSRHSLLRTYFVSATRCDAPRG